MSESITIDSGLSKSETYEQLLPQVRALVGVDRNKIAVLANCAAALHHGLGHFWTGFYLVEGQELVLGPFQGPVACMSIAKGRGVCGSVLLSEKTIIVPDVDQFPGHIACSSDSKSEIVVPIKDAQGNVCAVLDIDSRHLSTFDETDQFYLESFCTWLGEKIR